MHKIDYEEFFKHHDKTDFENDYLIALGWKKYDKGVLNYTYKYNKLNEIYKEITDNYSWLCLSFPSDLYQLVIDNFDKLVQLFINIYLMNGCVPESFKDEIKKIADYKGYSTSIRKFFSEQADELGVHSCAYCECAYTGSYEISNKEGETEGKGFFDLDHFFPKEEYPIFALCLYNFVPCCQICNSKRIKGDTPLLKFYNIDAINLNKAQEQLLQVSPISNKYRFDKDIFIRYFPKVEKMESEETTKKSKIDKEPKYKEWHYSPLSQSSAESYQVFFDCDFTKVENKSAEIKKAMKLDERYNSLAIKSKGLYLLDLKKKYPLSNIKMLSDLFGKSKYYISPDEIEKAIFHKNEKNILLEKMTKDILE